MADDEKEVTTEQPATADVTESTEDVDYAKELETVTSKVRAQEGYARRHEKDDEAYSQEELAEKVAAKIFPKLQAQTEKTILSQRLETLSRGNDSLKKLIQYHLDNSVNPNLDLDARLDVAYAAATKKQLEKTASEIKLAQQNRSQVSNSGQGSSTEVQKKPGQNIVSDDQLAYLKKKAETIGGAAGWDAQRKEKFVEDAIRSLATTR